MMLNQRASLILVVQTCTLKRYGLLRLQSCSESAKVNSRSSTLCNVHNLDLYITSFAATLGSAFAFMWRSMDLSF